MTNESAFSRWSLWPGVTVDTWLIPAESWQVRVHRLETTRSLCVADGGFPVADLRIAHTGKNALCLRCSEGELFGIMDVTGTRHAVEINPDPNASLLHSSVLIPVLTGELTPGLHWLTTVVLGAAPGSLATWEQAPEILTPPGESCRIQCAGHTSRIPLSTNGA